MPSNEISPPKRLSNSAQKLEDKAVLFKNREHSEEYASTTKNLSVEEGWQELLEKGLRSKIAMLQSKEFLTTGQVSKLLGVREPAIRRRIREQKLFALKSPLSDEYRIPAWALDPSIAGATTQALLSNAGPNAEWQVYLLMSRPQGALNGLRPFECLMSKENLPAADWQAREELNAFLKRPTNASLLPTVQRLLKEEINHENA